MKLDKIYYENTTYGWKCMVLPATPRLHDKWSAVQRQLGLSTYPMGLLLLGFLHPVTGIRWAGRALYNFREKTSNRGCHEAVAMRDFWDWWFQLGALDIPKFQSIVDYLSIYLSFQGSFQVLGCLGMSWASRQPIFQVEWCSMLVTARPGMLGWGVTVEAGNF
jgi:hypothetical protein